MEERVERAVAQLEAVLDDFGASLAIDLGSLEAAVADAVRSGQAQKFEFCVELGWKTMKRSIEHSHGFDLASPMTTLKKALELGLLDYGEYEAWLRGIELRNSLSHIYGKEEFERIHAELPGLYAPIRAILRAMKSA
jgi:nucleotidyltransferase substrate binding protein (TIGR01987 family)